MIHVDAISELVLLTCYSFLFNSINVMLDPCLSKECPMGSSCRVFEVTGEAYCEPSCELENGGCERHQKCELMNVTCKRTPCPPVVSCRGNTNSFNYAHLQIEMLTQLTILYHPFCLISYLVFAQMCAMAASFIKTTPIMRAIGPLSQGLHWGA